MPAFGTKAFIRLACGATNLSRLKHKDKPVRYQGRLVNDKKNNDKSKQSREADRLDSGEIRQNPEKFRKNPQNPAPSLVLFHAIIRKHD
jgi:hypothetical protein